MEKIFSRCTVLTAALLSPWDCFTAWMVPSISEDWEPLTHWQQHHNPQDLNLKNNHGHYQHYIYNIAMTVTGIYCWLLPLDILVTDVYSVTDMLLCQPCVSVGHMQFVNECVYCAYCNTCWCCVLQHLLVSHHTAIVQSDTSHRGREKICIMVAVIMFNMLNMTCITHLWAVIKMLLRKNESPLAL
jgi:hypothetical protein